MTVGSTSVSGPEAPSDPGDRVGGRAPVAAGEATAGEPVALHRSLSTVQRYLGAVRPDAVRTIQAQWPAIVGARLAGACEVHTVRQGHLVVHTTEPAVAEQLRWDSGDLRRAVNALLGAEEIVDVRIDVVVPAPPTR